MLYCSFSCWRGGRIEYRLTRRLPVRLDSAAAVTLPRHDAVVCANYKTGALSVLKTGGSAVA